MTQQPLDRQLAAAPVAELRMTAWQATVGQLVAVPAAEPRKVTWQKTVQQLAALSVLHREHSFPLRCSAWGDGSCIVNHCRRWKKGDENLVKAFLPRQNLQRSRDQLVAP